MENSIVRGLQERENEGLVVHDELGMAGNEGDTGCGAAKIVAAEPFIAERSKKETSVVVEDPHNVIIVGSVGGNSEDLQESPPWGREANMVVELADTKSRRWKRRAREKVDRELIMDPGMVGGKWVGSNLSGIVVAPKKNKENGL
ncbi:hypothetical protein ACOSP7_002551 [Xanthoceras sorbifolium]